MGDAPSPDNLTEAEVGRDPRSADQPRLWKLHQDMCLAVWRALKVGVAVAEWGALHMDEVPGAPLQPVAVAIGGEVHRE